MRNVELAQVSLRELSAARSSAARLLAPAITDMAPATTDTDPVTAITVPVQPTSAMAIMAAAPGSDSGSGTAMAGGFAAFAFAADPVHLPYKWVRRSRNSVFSGTFWLLA